MDRKSFAPAELKLSETGEITLAFAQLNVIDKDGDVTLPGAIPTKEVLMSAYGHTSWDGKEPIGIGTISEIGDWGVFTGRFLMDTIQGANAYKTIKEVAHLQEYSYGYAPKEFSFGERDGQQVRFLKSLDIYEVSPVLIGAGVDTHTMAIKSGGPDSGMPFADHTTWVTGQVKAYLDRFDDRHELRLKEGRTISAATMDELAAMDEMLGSVVTRIRALMTANQPPKAVDRVRLLLGEARSLGVSV